MPEALPLFSWALFLPVYLLGGVVVAKKIVLVMAWFILFAFFIYGAFVSPVSANIALTGQSFQTLLQSENIIGYEVGMTYSGPGTPGVGYYTNYQSSPVYYDPYMPNTARTIQSESSSPIKYAAKTPVRDLLNMVDQNGNKVFTIGAEGTAVAQSAAKAIAKKALGFGSGFVIAELVDPAVLGDGTIQASGYTLGQLSSSSDPDITAAELQAKIAENNGIDTSGTGTGFSPDGTVYTSPDNMQYSGCSYIGPIYAFPPYPPDFYATATVVGGVSGYYIQILQPSWYNPSYPTRKQWLRYWSPGSPVAVSGAFDPADYPELYQGTRGAFNALAELIDMNAEIEMNPIDPALLDIFLPDSDTAFMRYGAETSIGDKDYLIGPNGSIYPKPSSMTTNLPQVDGSSIGLLADPTAPGGQQTIISNQIDGIPQGSTILDIDPQTGLIKFRTPEGYESTKYATTTELQTLQSKIGSPYYDGSGLPWSYSSSSSNSTSTTINTTVDREDYSVSIPDLPSPPSLNSTFDVPEPEPWPWADWITNPFNQLIESMQIEANGSPYLMWPINLPYAEPFTITIDFSEYESQMSQIGGYLVLFAYFMAIFIVLRAKN